MSVGNRLRSPIVPIREERARPRTHVVDEVVTEVCGAEYW